MQRRLAAGRVHPVRPSEPLGSLVSKGLACGLKGQPPLCLRPLAEDGLDPLQPLGGGESDTAHHVRKPP